MNRVDKLLFKALKEAIIARNTLSGFKNLEIRDCNEFTNRYYF